MPLNEARLARFQQVARDLRGDVSIVVTQVDPDALASALTIADVLATYDEERECRIVYCGAFGHAQNRAIANKFNLKKRMLPICDVDPHALKNVVLVDSSLGSDSRIPAEVKLAPRIVIDHHRGSDLTEREGEFFWIEDAGATSTMVIELLRALGIELNGERQPLAALLTLGIYTDTKGLLAATHRDRDAFDHASQFTSFQDLQPLINYPLPQSHYRNLAHALNHHEARDARLVASCGTIQPDAGDDLSTIADYFMRMEGIALVCVWGIIGTSVRISARNANLSAPLDEFLKKRFGPASGAKLTPSGKAEGGARIRLDLGPWMSDATRAEVEAMVSARIRELIFQDP